MDHCCLSSTLKLFREKRISRMFATSSDFGIWHLRIADSRGTIACLDNLVVPQVHSCILMGDGCISSILKPFSEKRLGRMSATRIWFLPPELWMPAALLYFWTIQCFSKSSHVYWWATVVFLAFWNLCSPSPMTISFWPLNAMQENITLSR